MRMHLSARLPRFIQTTVLVCALVSFAGCTGTPPASVGEARASSESAAAPDATPALATAPAATPPTGSRPDNGQALRPANAQSVRALTDARARLVWVQSSENDAFAAGTALVLMGMDTEDGRGERVILGDRGSYIKPLFTARGERILFTRRGDVPHHLSTFIVNWDGSDLHRLADGAALAVWEEPGGGREWVYVGTDNTAEAAGDFRTLSRFPLDKPDARELVWNKTPVSGDTFQVSADGRTAGGLFPWPHAGIADLPNGQLRTVGEGCWTAFRDADVGLFWYFDGSHRNVTIVERTGNRRWTVPLNQAPGFENPEVYHPRWANHPRFVAISGPYNQGGTNQVRTGGAQTEIYLGRFSADYSRIEAWARVTENASVDSYPDVWVDRARSPHRIEVARSDAAGPGTTAPPDLGPRRIVVEARLTSAAEIPAPRSIAPYRHALVVNVFDVLDVVEGEYREPRLIAAQWAIRDARVLDEARRRAVGTTMRLTLERYDAHPELEGERLIAAGDGPNLPLYYDVGSRP